MTPDVKIGWYRWAAWAKWHDSHGPSLDTVVFLPDGIEPDDGGEWVRVKWLDQPRGEE